MAIGLLVEARMALLLGHLQEKVFNQIMTILKRYGLPMQLPIDFPFSEILHTMTLDKKALEKRPRFVLLDSIGSPGSYGGAYCSHVDEKVIIQALHWMKNDLCGD